MPNVSPFGLFGRSGAAWKAPDAVYARDAGVWKPAVAVYAFKNGVWKLIWAPAGLPPTSVTIAYVPTQVTVSWVVPAAPIADSYSIYRPDGSFAGSASVAGSPFVDVDPRPLVGSYRMVGVLGGVDGPTSTSSNSLDLTLTAATLTATLNNGGTTSATIDLAWTANALGAPESWNIYRAGVLLVNVPGASTSYTDTSPPPGIDALNYQIVAVLSGVEGGTRAASLPINASPPTSVACAANGNVGQIQLTWGTPAGTFTGFEIQSSVDGSAWSAGSTAAANIRTVPVTFPSPGSGLRYVRIRTVSAGGVSEWVQCSATPLWDATPPPNANITSWKPESSYGRMVVRFTTPTSAAAPDLNSYLVQQRLAGGTWVNVGSWTAAANNTTYAVVCATRSAGQVAEVKVLLRDDVLNTNTGDTATYTLQATPKLIDPSGDKSGTWRIGTTTSDWRNDATRAANEIATGWTSSGPNIGCYLYGTTIDAALGTLTIVSATIEYWRENEGGLGAAIQPLFWTHDRTSRSGAPNPNAQGVAESSRLGSAVARTGTTGGAFTLPAAFIAALQAGTAKGLCMYRNYVGSGDPDNYYMLMSIGDVTGGSPSKVNGRLTFNHLG